MKNKQRVLLAVSVIVTVLNEEKTIQSLVDALAVQLELPSEVIIIDGGSSDRTLHLLQAAKEKFPVPLRIQQKRGNRSVGRNVAVSLSSQQIIAVTDAGCIPQSNWLSELCKIHKQSNSPVIAGYYSGVATTPFEEAVIPYALVMPKNIDEKKFLPATRSMLFEKKIWVTLGGFDESLSDNEDFAFANKLVAKKIQITFARTAVVLWKPRSTLSSFYWMIFRFARGDMQAKIIRFKVLVIFARYVLVIILYAVLYTDNSFLTNTLLLIGCSIYASWAVLKNIRYVPQGWYWLPVLQVVSDIAVLHGSIAGLVNRRKLKRV